MPCLVIKVQFQFSLSSMLQGSCKLDSTFFRYFFNVTSMLNAVTYSVLVFQNLMEYRPLFLFNAFVHTEFKFNYLMQKYLQSCRKDTNTLHYSNRICSFFITIAINRRAPIEKSDKEIFSARRLRQIYQSLLIFRPLSNRVQFPDLGCQF